VVEPLLVEVGLVVLAMLVVLAAKAQVEVH
jgi:hypothetical protein